MLVMFGMRGLIMLALGDMDAMDETKAMQVGTTSGIHMNFCLFVYLIHVLLLY
jgi:hypothetical protein